MGKTYRKVSRGQVWYLVDPRSDVYDGNIQGKNRPVLVISNDHCNESSPVIHVIPLTTQSKNDLPVHVHFNDGKFDQTILCEQTRPVRESLFHDKSYYKYTLSGDIMQKVDEAMAVQFGLSLIMPNSERFWKSVEQVIRQRVKQAIDESRVSALDITKVSCLLTKAIDDSIPREPDIAEPEPIDDKPVEESEPAIKQGRIKWTEEMKKDFLDTYYKYGPQETANKLNIKIKSIYAMKCKFDKEVKNYVTT